MYNQVFDIVVWQNPAWYLPAEIRIVTDTKRMMENEIYMADFAPFWSFLAIKLTFL